MPLQSNVAYEYVFQMTVSSCRNMPFLYACFLRILKRILKHFFLYSEKSIYCLYHYVHFTDHYCYQCHKGLIYNTLSLFSHIRYERSIHVHIIIIITVSKCPMICLVRFQIPLTSIPAHTCFNVQRKRTGAGTTSRTRGSLPSRRPAVSRSGGWHGNRTRTAWMKSV